MTNTLEQTFAGKRVLVTGDTGFKGSWLCFWLHQLGAKVSGFALPPHEDAPLFDDLNLARTIDHIDADIRNYDSLESAFSKAKPEIVFHLAAQALVRDSYDDPKTTFDTNVGGGVNLMEAVRKNNSVRALVFITSDKCYQNQEWVWGYRENDRLGGHDPYSASKAAAEIMFSAYRDSFLNGADAPGIATVRAGNVIGGGDWSKNRIVPDCMRALTRNEAIELRSPNATRPWQHVLEPLSGYLKLAGALLDAPERYSGAWNFGPAAGSVATVRTLADTIVSTWGAGKIVENVDPNAPHEANLLQLNTDKAQIELGWQPRWDGTRGVTETVNWYKAVHEGAKPSDITSSQIAAYMDMEI